ncbi:MAG TPA: DoxX family protein [Actinomycetota bacterium]|nr:DoxX family protein [Actinomycetota bacterium]
METGLLLLRVALGTLIAAHGAQKLFGWFGGPGLSGTAGWLESMGFKPGRVHATMTGLAEFGGGALLALGLLTPLGAAAAAGVMIVAIVTVHWSNGFFNTPGGYEFNLLVAVSAIVLAFTGPGRISFDNALGLELAGTEWGIAALALSALSAVMVLASRKHQLIVAEEEKELETPRQAA